MAVKNSIVIIWLVQYTRSYVQSYVSINHLSLSCYGKQSADIPLLLILPKNEKI